LISVPPPLSQSRLPLPASSLALHFQWGLTIAVLDPLVFGVIPESLLPVIGYSCIVAVFAWFVVGKIALRLIRLAVGAGGLGETKTSGQKVE